MGCVSFWGERIKFSSDFLITILLFKNAKFCFVIPDFQAFLRNCGTQGTLKKLEDHMAHPTEEKNVGTSSTSVN